MKSEKELNEIKEEIENLNHKIAELSEEELIRVIGGVHADLPRKNPDERYVMGIRPVPVEPISPIVSKKCRHKPCSYSGKDVCPYYSDEIGDCVF